jgi:hypothetical protein
MLVLVRGSSAKTVKAGLVSFVISMREIETCDAQTSVDEVLEHWNIPASRSKEGSVALVTVCNVMLAPRSSGPCPVDMFLFLVLGDF